jgi:hypothetical protein
MTVPDWTLHCRFYRPKRKAACTNASLAMMIEAGRVTATARAAICAFTSPSISVSLGLRTGV